MAVEVYSKLENAWWTEAGKEERHLLNMGAAFRIATELWPVTEEHVGKVLYQEQSDGSKDWRASIVADYR